jgi:hypothetical protein
VLLRPFKLVTVFLHEASHAIACKLTCGHVRTCFLPLYLSIPRAICVLLLVSTFWLSETEDGAINLFGCIITLEEIVL